MNLEKMFVSNEVLEFIHEQSLEVLKKSGCIFEHEKTLEIFSKNGFKIDGSTVYFTREDVEKAISMAPASYDLTKLNGETYTMGLGSKTMATAGSPPYVLDENNEIRFSLMKDYIDICKIVETSDVIDMTHLLLCDAYDVPRDIRSLKMLANLLRYTSLPISLTSLATDHDDSGVIARRMIEMISNFYGYKDKYIAVGCVSPISPLAYVKDALDSLIVYCEMNQPIQLATCSLPVLTSPASLVGTIIQNNAELLAGIVLAQLLQPGIPIIYGNTSTSTNLREISMALGSSESTLISIATSALAKYYNIPSRASGALTDAVDIDFQAGVESAMTLMAGVLSDVDLMYFSCGMLSGFNVTSLSKYIVDEQLIKMIKRIDKGINVDITRNYADEINKVGPRGSYLKGRTPKDYRKEHFVPDVFVKIDFNSWKTDDAKSIKEKANNVVNERLANYKEPDITKEQFEIIKKYL